MPPIKGDDGTTSGIPVPPPGTFGVLGDSNAGYGVVGTSGGPAAVYGESKNSRGSAEFGIAGSGVVGVNDHVGGVGVRGRGSEWGVLGDNGVLGLSQQQGSGVVGIADQGSGVAGDSTSGSGVYGSSQWGAGVAGYSQSGTGVWGNGGQYGLVAFSNGVGAYVPNTGGSGNSAYLATRFNAAEFYGSVFVSGYLYKLGGGFLIDHPSDPANQYLSHSFVESPDRKNIYDGVIELDARGEAIVELPDWLSTLNHDFRYQLTCIGSHAPVFVAKEIAGNRFRIAGGSPGIKVSWQVTGIRQDPWAKANPVNPVIMKPEKERGTFLTPELHGQPKEKSVQRGLHPEVPEPPKVPPTRPSRPR